MDSFFSEAEEKLSLQESKYTQTKKRIKQQLKKVAMRDPTKPPRVDWDWMALGLIKVRPTKSMGLGVFARVQFDEVDAEVAHSRRVGKLGGIISMGTHWTGCINHGPPSRANVAFANMYMTQLPNRPVEEGEQLLRDYGMPYWVFEITRIDIIQWESYRKELWSRASVLFQYMHETVEDYGQLLRLRLWEITDNPLGMLLRLETCLATHYKYRTKVESHTSPPSASLP